MKAWRLDLTIPKGHRFFLNPEGRVAVADRSGVTPDTTDDGVLWLDRTKDITVGYMAGDDSRIVATVPLLRADSSTCYTGCEAKYATEVAERYGMNVTLSVNVAELVRTLRRWA